MAKIAIQHSWGMPCSTRTLGLVFLWGMRKSGWTVSHTEASICFSLFWLGLLFGMNCLFMCCFFFRGSAAHEGCRWAASSRSPTEIRCWNIHKMPVFFLPLKTTFSFQKQCRLCVWFKFHTCDTLQWVWVSHRREATWRDSLWPACYSASGGMFSPLSQTNLLSRAAVDVGILRAFSIDLWDLVEGSLGEVADCFCRSVSSHRDTLRMFTWFKIMHKSMCIKSLFTHAYIKGMCSWDDGKFSSEIDSIVWDSPHPCPYGLTFFSELVILYVCSISIPPLLINFLLVKE